MGGGGGGGLIILEQHNVLEDLPLLLINIRYKHLRN